MNNKNIWDKIIKFLEKKHNMHLISFRGQTFDLEEITQNKIKIRFSSGNTINIEKQRFESAYNYLKEKNGEWIKIGASRINTDPKTIEGRIKQKYDGKMNGLSTAPWIATILVKVFDNIEFNGKKKGQAIKMR